MLELKTERLIIKEDNGSKYPEVITCGIFLKGDTISHTMERIGTADLDYYDRRGYCYISYGIEKEEHRRKRYATKVLYNLTKFCIEQGDIPCVEIPIKNEASQGVARKCGYSCDDTVIDYLDDISTISDKYIAWAYLKKR